MPLTGITTTTTKATFHCVRISRIANRRSSYALGIQIRSIVKVPVKYRNPLTQAFRSRLGQGLGNLKQGSVALNHLQARNSSTRSANTSSSASANTLPNMGAIATGRVDTSKRVADLRKLMKQHQVSVYVVPSEDEHASEYPAEADLRRAYITGFTGSAGCAVIDDKEAALFTDGRYFLQAGQQLEPNVWKLMKQGEPNVPTWQEYLVKNIPPKSKIGIDPTLISVDDAATLAKELAGVGSSFVPIGVNLVDQVWAAADRPARPSKSIFVLDEKYTGRSVHSKVQELRSELKKKGDHIKGTVANMLDEVAWLLNLRGSDVPYNPVFFAFAVVLLDKVTLYVRESQLEQAAKEYIAKDVIVRPYEEFYNDLQKLGAALKEDEKIYLSKRASMAIQEALGGASNTLVDRSIVIDQKSIKNETEIKGFRDSHIRDGAALASYFAWLEEQLQQGKNVSEYGGAEELEKFRARDAHFRGPSFTTISSTGANGAIIHYSPDPKDCPDIDAKQMYLCDSGAQFTDGTTDVTRTLHFGKPDDEQIRAFTRVLQGHIAIDRAVFSSGTTGYQLDCLARRPLWGEGWDFRHGVGHGVGHFLNVHEPPQGISTRAIHNETSLKDGMVISNEPGFYKDGAWGIRIENLIVVRKAKTPNSFGSKGYLCFERLTFCPIQRSLIDASLLDQDERQWINEYHDETLAKVGPVLQSLGDERGLAWLKRNCSERV